MEGVVYCMNAGFGLFGVDVLGTVFDGNVCGIKLGLDNLFGL